MIVHCSNSRVCRPSLRWLRAARGTLAIYIDLQLVDISCSVESTRLSSTCTIMYIYLPACLAGVVVSAAMLLRNHKQHDQELDFWSLM